MYNEERKRKFIQNYTNSINTANVCEALFNLVEKHEYGWRADICTKKTEELQPVINELIGLRMKSKWARLIILKDYVRWCMIQGVPNVCDGIFHVNTIGLDNIRERMVSSPVHLEHYLNDVFDPVEWQTIDNTRRCYYWLAYAGLSESKAFDVKVSDVDFFGMLVKHEETEVPIYRESIAAYRNCAELDQFLLIHPSYKVWKDRVPGDKLLRGTRKEATAQSFRTMMAKNSREKREKGVTKLRLSYYRAWLSGLFYRTYENERMGISPDFSEVVAHQSVGKVYKLDSGRNTQEAKYNQLARDYLNDYRRWKLAFKM